jgi:hypothetical protein
LKKNPIVTYDPKVDLVAHRNRAVRNLISKQGGYSAKIELESDGNWTDKSSVWIRILNQKININNIDLYDLPAHLSYAIPGSDVYLANENPDYKGPGLIVPLKPGFPQSPKGAQRRLYKRRLSYLLGFKAFRTLINAQNAAIKDA